MKKEDYFSIGIKDGVATVWMDNTTGKQNIISPDMIAFFDDVFQSLDRDPEVKAVVLISRKKDFIAGADIKAFKGEIKGDFAPFIRKGHQSMNQIAASKKPIIAAIHGTCFGLGCEISLACHARIASDDGSTKIALPEVRLGLLPGGGGTQRLPRLVGIQAALDMMLTGKNIFAYRAKKMGLVDELTHKSKLHSAAIQIAQKMVAGKWERPKPKKSLLSRFLDNTGWGRSIVFKQARKMSFRQAQGNYPAIPEIINCAEIGLKKGMEAGLNAEAEKFEELMLGQVSKELRGIFFAMTDNKKNYRAENARPLDNLGILGAGLMGTGIAEVSINNGIDVLLKDLKAEMLTDSKREIWKGLSQKINRKAMSRPQAEEVMQRLQTRLDYSGFGHADVVIEAIVENMEVKKKVIREIGENCKGDVIIASNTSSLSLTEMAGFAKHPENVIGMHYFSPVPKMPLLEIVKTDKTADWVIDSCYEMGVRQGKTVIVVKDGPGFYVNRILAPYINECLLLIEEGAKLEEVDQAMKKKGFPVGPIQLLDEVGLDIAAHIMAEGMAKYAEEREGFKASTGVIGMYKAGYHGRKNGKGFYSYPPLRRGLFGKRRGRRKPDNNIYQYFGKAPRKQLDREEMQNRAIMLMLNEAVMCLEEGIIAGPADGDLGAVFGIGFLPFTGGPFRYMDYLGPDKVVDTLKKLEAKYGPKFRPAKMLTELGAKKGKFHVTETDAGPSK